MPLDDQEETCRWPLLSLPTLYGEGLPGPCTELSVLHHQIHREGRTHKRLGQLLGQIRPRKSWEVWTTSHLMWRMVQERLKESLEVIECSDQECKMNSFWMAWRNVKECIVKWRSFLLWSRNFLWFVAVFHSILKICFALFYLYFLIYSMKYMHYCHIEILETLHGSDQDQDPSMTIIFCVAFGGRYCKLEQWKYMESLWRCNQGNIFR